MNRKYLIFTAALLASASTLFALTYNSGLSAGTPVFGTQTNDNASTGFVGEYVSSACSAIVLTTGVYSNVCGQLTLTPGDWDVSATISLTANGATYTRVDLEALIGTSNGDNTTGAALGDTYLVIDHATLDTTWNFYPFSFSSKRKSITSSTTYYLKAYGGATSSGAPKMSGIIHARRFR